MGGSGGATACTCCTSGSLATWLLGVATFIGSITISSDWGIQAGTYIASLWAIISALGDILPIPADIIILIMLMGTIRIAMAVIGLVQKVKMVIKWW